MILLAWSGLLFSGTALCAGAPYGPVPAVGAAAADSLNRLYDAGRPFTLFLATTRSRRETWIHNSAAARIPPDLLARARAVSGRWRLLAVADDWCGDSAHTLPFIARLIDSLPSLSLRIVGSQRGRWVLERHRAPDGRAATPTIILFDSAGAELGCFIERPVALQAWLADHAPRLTGLELRRGRDAWRREDAGQATLRDIVELLEAAARGVRHCAAGAP